MNGLFCCGIGIDHRIVHHFKTIATDFYPDYITVNVVHDEVRQTGIDSIIKFETSGLIKGATIKNLKSGRIVRTDLLGKYEHEPNCADLTDFECSATGHHPQTKTIKLIHTCWILKPLE